MALIPDLPASTSVASTDVFIKDTGSATQKITAPNLAAQLLGQTSVTYTNTVANIIVAGSDVTISSADFVQWGKIAQVDITFTINDAISVQSNGNCSDILVGTLVSGKRPRARLLGFLTFGNGYLPFGFIATDGTVNITEFSSRGSAYTVAAGATLRISAVYLLA